MQLVLTEVPMKKSDRLFPPCLYRNKHAKLYYNTNDVEWEQFALSPLLFWYSPLVLPKYNKS